MSYNEVVLLLGSNLGNQKKNIEEALVHINEHIGKVLIQSDFFETQPVEFVSCNNFINFALILNTHLSPIELLKSIKKIERRMGRIIDSKAFGGYRDRIIDIDIVTFNKVVFKSKQLSLPHHKHLFERSFSKEILENLFIKKHNI